MFLHGCGMMHYWWWPPNPGGFYASSMKHSHLRSLPEVAAVMRTALDVRRMPGEIAAFRGLPTEVSLLYPEASLIQKFPAAQGHKTPFSMEVEKTYGSAVRLNASVGFASSKRIKAGGLKDTKLLLVPGCRFVAEDVHEKVLEWVRGGGTMMVTPTSLVADEYNRKRDYLGKLGIEILTEELPEMMAGEAVRGIDQEPGEMDFIQGPVAKTIVTKQPKRGVVTIDKDLRLPAEMSAEGILQTVKASKDWTTMASYADGKGPAMLSRKLGEGRIIYLAGQLALADRKTLIDRVMARCGVGRPIRAYAPDRSYPDGVEFRAVGEGNAYLAYLANTSLEPREIVLKADLPLALGRIRNVSAGVDQKSGKITLAPLETRILRIDTETFNMP